MPDSYLVDSNILLRLSGRNDPDYEAIALTLERLLGEATRLCYTQQNIAEFWNVWTRPVDKNGFGLSGETAEREVLKFETMMDLVPDSAAIYRTWREIIRDYRVIGVQVHDARLVASMLAHGIPKLLTLNVQDFTRYNGLITVVHPGTFVSRQ